MVTVNVLDRMIAIHRNPGLGLPQNQPIFDLEMGILTNLVQIEKNGHSIKHNGEYIMYIDNKAGIHGLNDSLWELYARYTNKEIPEIRSTGWHT